MKTRRYVIIILICLLLIIRVLYYLGVIDWLESWFQQNDKLETSSEFIYSGGSIVKMHVNSSSITITGFHFHPSNSRSEWVDRIFGNLSVHFVTEKYIMKQRKRVSDDEKRNASMRMKTMIDIDAISKTHYSCYIDLLGYSFVSVKSSPNSNPFSIPSRLIGPAIGNASLIIPSINKTISCLYRGLFENWRPELDISSPNFWSTLIYCPMTSSTCKRVKDHVISTQNYQVDMRMNMMLSFVERETYFTAQFLQNVTKVENDQQQMGICTAIPYTSTIKNKYDVNGKLLVHWIKYYSLLGIKVFIYDRDAANANFIETYLKQNSHLLNSLVYVNYTIRGLLDKSTFGMQYDNNDKISHENAYHIWKPVFTKQGFDKTLTLTQCRFDAKASHGIDHIIVADYDEFLYCAPVEDEKIEMNTMRNKFHHVMKSSIENGFDQVTLAQKLILNRTDEPQKCVIENMKENKSLFDCFGSIKYPIAFQSIKSIHLGYKCPLTNYHEACPSNGIARSYDCYCKSKSFEDDVCSFIHISTKQEHYNNPDDRDENFQYDNQKVSQLLKEENELTALLH